MAGLYIHIPFTTHLSPYRNDYATAPPLLFEPYVDAVRSEIEYYAAEYAEQEPITTIYFGGGMPSLLPTPQINRILSAVYARFDTAQLQEITYEVTPSHCTPTYVDGLHAIGINRVSLDIQSFFEEDLDQLGAPHTPEQATSALSLIQQTGFANVSIDLVFGLPNQPMEYWAANLERAVRLKIPHLSTYGLAVDDAPNLYPSRVPINTDAEINSDETAEQFRFTMEYLQSQGYEHYELNSFSLPDRQSLHSQGYWHQANHLGFGPSARSAWCKPEGMVYCWTNVPNLAHYQAMLAQHHLPLESKFRASLDELADGYLITRLRTSDGLDLNYFESEYGVDLLSERIEALAWLESEGYIHRVHNGRVRLTNHGKLYLGHVIERLLPN